MKNARRFLLAAVSCYFALSFAWLMATASMVNAAEELPAIVIGVSNVQSGPSAALGQNLLAVISHSLAEED